MIYDEPGLTYEMLTQLEHLMRAPVRDFMFTDIVHAQVKFGIWKVLNFYENV